MTKEERQQWQALASEADAEKFVTGFLAKREPGFAAEIAKRAQQADKYLTIADRPGSQTLRGKVVVLFGPPSGLNISNRAATTTKRDNPIMAGALSNAGSVGGGRVGRCRHADRRFDLDVAGHPRLLDHLQRRRHDEDDRQAERHLRHRRRRRDRQGRVGEPQRRERSGGALRARRTCVDREKVAARCHPERESRDPGGRGAMHVPRAPPAQVPRLTLGMTRVSRNIAHP